MLSIYLSVYPVCLSPRLYFGWEKRLVQHHDAVKTIDSACSRWRALNAIEQTDADLWKPFVREIVR